MTARHVVFSGGMTPTEDGSLGDLLLLCPVCGWMPATEWDAGHPGCPCGGVPSCGMCQPIADQPDQTATTREDR